MLVKYTLRLRYDYQEGTADNIQYQEIKNWCEENNICPSLKESIQGISMQFPGLSDIMVIIDNEDMATAFKWMYGELITKEQHY